MDRIQKYLQKLSKTERTRIAKVVRLIVQRNFDSLDVKKLRGFDDIFRVRVGNTRIVYQQTGKEIRILEIAVRSEKTYRKF